MWRRWVLVVLGLTCAAATWAVARLPDGRVHVWVLDGGRGLIVLTPSGQAVLVDTLPDPRQTTAVLGRVLPPWEHTLRLAVNTATSSGEVAAQATVLETYPAQEGWMSPSAAASPATDAWRQRVSRVRGLREGAAWMVDGVRWRVIASEPLVLLLEAGAFRLMYAPRDAPEAQGLPPALVWVGGRLPISAPSPFPLFVITWEPLPADDNSAARQVLAHPETRFFLGMSGRFHFVTDGHRYRWEGPLR